MDKLVPLQTLYEAKSAQAMPMPAELETIYGQLAFPLKEGEPFLISNFVQTMDGVVTLGIRGHESGGDISGHSPQDLMIMGLLRAAADAVIITSTSLRVGGNHLHVAAEIFPPFADAYRTFRSRLAKPDFPLQVVVTGSGKIPVNHKIFKSGEAPALVVTTEKGKDQLIHRGLPASIPVIAVRKNGVVPAPAIVKAILQVCESRCQLLLSEGGPHLLGTLLAGDCLNELFLTLAPQLAGRDHQMKRLGLVSGHMFAPRDPRWGELVSVKRGASQLFLRYRFEPNRQV